jgi:hypothetical protein
MELDLRKDLRVALRSYGVTLAAIKPAKVRSRNRVAWLPVSGGEVDPTTGKGVIVHRGRVGFRRGRRHIFMRAVTLDTRRRIMTARVGQEKVRVATIRQISFDRNGFGSDVVVRNLRLTGRLARIFNARLGTGLFRSTQRFARSSSSTQPRTVKVVPVVNPHPALRSGFMFFRPDLSALTKLETKGVTYLDWPCNPCSYTVAPVSPANFIGGPRPSFAFQISGKRIAPDSSGGVITTTGGIRIATSDPISNPAVLIIRDIWLELASGVVTANVEFQPSPPAPGDIGRTTIATIDSSEAAVGAGTKPLRVSFSNGLVRLTKSTAPILNQVFPGLAAGDFVSGDAVFRLAFTADAR